MESVELALARHAIARYEQDANDDSLIRASIQGQDCLDCEAFLEKGIQAISWLERSEQALIEAANEGLIEFTTDMEAAIEELYVSWLRPCNYANQWIAVQEQRGFDVKHLEVFREACARAQNWLERNATFKLSKSARDARFAEEPW